MTRGADSTSLARREDGSSTAGAIIRSAPATEPSSSQTGAAKPNSADRWRRFVAKQEQESLRWN